MVDLKMLDIKPNENDKKAVADSAVSFFSNLDKILSGSMLSSWIEQVKKIIAEISSSFDLLKTQVATANNQVNAEIVEVKNKVKELQGLEAKLTSLKTDLETKLTAERAVITQVAQTERKNISENSKVESGKIGQLIQEAKTEAERIEKISKENLEKMNKELENFRIQHIAVLEKDLRVLQNNVKGAAELLGRKE